jgi:hypothetical protein
MSRNFELLQRLGLANTPLDPIDTSARNGTSHIERCVERQSALVDTPQELHRLVQRLFLGSPVPMCIAFCPVDARSAPHHLAARAAELLAARTASSVCVVDAAFDSPSVHEHFGVPLKDGLADALLETRPISSFAHRIDGQELAVVTTGCVGPEARTAFQSEGLARRVRELRAQFHYVLVEGPPSSDYGAAAFLGRLVDGVVLVIEAHATRRDAAFRTKTELQQGNILVLGAVLNNRTFPIPESVYSKLF